MLKKILACAAVLGVAGALPVQAADHRDDRDTLFKFDGGIGSQPLRVGPASNAVAGVAPGGAPWPVRSLKATIRTDGHIDISVKGILLGGTDNIGTRGGPRRMVVSLFCRGPIVAPAVAGPLVTASYNSDFVDLDPDGNFKLSSLLTNAAGATPPLDCGDKVDNRPVLLIRTVTAATATTPAAPSAWFAAGILKADSDD
jgi:hypothetical protein